MTPFIQLTLRDGKPCFINILQVVLVEPRIIGNKHHHSYGESYTYIVLAGGESITRNVTDSYESVMEAIIGYHKNRDFVAKSLSPKV